ncbi:MAG TPA: hypothetical protein VKT29_14775, partial [Terriglobales bacterium]|nr:hypothetical protein [Terriglobales bacterium]
MKNILLSLLFLLLWSLPSAGQTHPAIYRIKSWKTGTAQAQPQTLNISLSTAEREYRKVITDVGGQPLYQLSVRPAAFVGPGDGIIAWHVYLTTLDSQDNLLLPS